MAMKLLTLGLLAVILACEGCGCPSGSAANRWLMDNSQVIKGNDGTSCETALFVNRRSSTDPFMKPYEEQWLAQVEDEWVYSVRYYRDFGPLPLEQFRLMTRHTTERRGKQVYDVITLT